MNQSVAAQGPSLISVDGILISHFGMGGGLLVFDDAQVAERKKCVACNWLGLGGQCLIRLIRS